MNSIVNLHATLTMSGSFAAALNLQLIAEIQSTDVTALSSLGANISHNILPKWTFNFIADNAMAAQVMTELTDPK